MPRGKWVQNIMLQRESSHQRRWEDTSVQIPHSHCLNHRYFHCALKTLDWKEKQHWKKNNYKKEIIFCFKKKKFRNSNIWKSHNNNNNSTKHNFFFIIIFSGDIFTRCTKTIFKCYPLRNVTFKNPCATPLEILQYFGKFICKNITGTFSYFYTELISSNIQQYTIRSGRCNIWCQ